MVDQAVATSAVTASLVMPSTVTASMRPDDLDLRDELAIDGLVEESLVVGLVVDLVFLRCSLVGTPSPVTA